MRRLPWPWDRGGAGPGGERNSAERARLSSNARWAVRVQMMGDEMMQFVGLFFKGVGVNLWALLDFCAANHRHDYFKFDEHVGLD